MRGVPSADTSVEKLARSVLHSKGFRFSIGRRELPGKPDIVLRRHRTVIFVHGCFWHGHRACSKGVTLPARNRTFWANKLRYNKAKDKRVATELRQQGWKVITVWECQTTDPKRLVRILTRKLRENAVKSPPC